MHAYLVLEHFFGSSILLWEKRLRLLVGWSLLCPFTDFVRWCASQEMISSRVLECAWIDYFIGVRPFSLSHWCSTVLSLSHFSPGTRWMNGHVYVCMFTCWHAYRGIVDVSRSHTPVFVGVEDLDGSFYQRISKHSLAGDDEELVILLHDFCRSPHFIFGLFLCEDNNKQAHGAPRKGSIRRTARKQISALNDTPLNNALAVVGIPDFTFTPHDTHSHTSE